MKYSGLYFIPIHTPSVPPTTNPENTPPTPLQILTNYLENKYLSATSLSSWSLNHRLLRSTPLPPSQAPPSTDQSKAPQSYHHVLNLSHHAQQKTYLYIHPPTPPPQTEDNKGIIVAIPSQHTESFYSLLTGKLSSLWHSRQLVQLRDGLRYQIGEFDVLLGELRTGPATTSTPSHRPGLVVCISVSLGGSSDQSSDGTASSRTLVGSQESREQEKKEWERGVEETQRLIRTFWESLKPGVEVGKEGVKEVMMRADYEECGRGRAEEKDREQERWEEVRMWCEVLKLKN